MKNLKLFKLISSVKPMVKTFVILLLSSVVVLAAGRKIFYKQKIKKTFQVQTGGSSDPISASIAHSPDASNVIKFIDIPVNLYTGTPTIDIPITSISENNLNVPVSLSYHASGHKVREVAASVGLGWKLNAGGMITRKINGLADDIDVGMGFLEFRNNYSYSDIVNTVNNQDEVFATNTLVTGCHDIQPDEYYLDINGFTATFVFDWTGNLPIVSSSSDIEIVSYTQNPINNWITEWIIRTPDGVTYTFADLEVTSVSSSTFNFCQTSFSYPSSWYITRIENTTTADVIDFSYTSYNMELNLLNHYTKQLGHPSTNTNCSDWWSTSLPPSITHSSTSIMGQRLTHITSSEREIELVGLNLRQDVNGLYNLTNTLRSLDEVILREKGQPSTFITKHHLSYFYQGNRLMLNQIQQEGRNGDLENPYIFEYNNGNLPSSVNSNSIDHWGFNNNVVNSTLIPPYMKTFNMGSYTEVVKYGEANRDPNLLGSEASILNKITYPTGGYKELEYELHDYGFTEGEKVSEVYPYQVIPEVLYGNVSGDMNQSGTFQQATYPFTINASPNDDIVLSVRVNGQSFSSFGGTAFMPQAIIYDASGSQVFNHVLVPNSNNNGDVDEYKHSFLISSGNYTLELKAMNSTMQAFGGGNDYVSCQLDWNWKDYSVVTHEKDIGGVRVKKMKTFSSNTDPNPIVKKYLYTNTIDGVEFSSGAIYTEPVYDYEGVSIIPVVGTGSISSSATICNHTNVLGTSLLVTEMTNGSHIGYREVTVLEGENGEQGKTIYEYDSPYEYPDGINSDFPFARPYTNKHKTGLLKKKSIYQKSGISFDLIQEISNTYSFSEISIDAPLFQRGKTLNSAGGNLVGLSLYNSLPFEEKFAYNFTPIRLGYGKITQITNTTYLNGQSIVNSSNYTYSTDLKYLLEERTSNSDGIEYIVRYKYPKDYAVNSLSWNSYNDVATKGIAKMIFDHKVAIPIETRTLIKKPGWSEPKVIGSRLTTFKDFGGGLVLPYQIFRSKIENPKIEGSNAADFNISSIDGSGNFIKDATYNDGLLGSFLAYEINGVLKSFMPNQGIPTSYIWNNNKTLPVAKAINTNANEIFYTSFEEDADASSSYSKTGTKSKKKTSGQLQITSPNLISGTYTLTYWEKRTNSGTWEYKERTINYTAGNSISINDVPFTTASYIDEVRIYPEDALMTTYTYDENTRQITYINNANNQLARLEYDAFNRLENIYDFEDNLIKHKEYNFQNSTGTGNEVYNYIKEWTFLKENVSPTDNFDAIARKDKAEVIQFSDGLGRPIQAIGVGMATNGGDIISHTEYDEFGRVSKRYLPFVADGNNGNYFTTASVLQRNFNYSLYQTFNSFAETVYDNSPLNRVVEQGAPGDDWQIGSGHTKEVERRTNTALEVRDFENNNFFAANELYVVKLKDEDGRTGWIYKDKFGRTIMVNRRINTGVGNNKNTEDVSTYYIYDDFGRVVKVITPEGTKLLKANSWNLSAAAVQEQMYKYEYDERGRMIRKKLPSAEWITIIYDKLDRPVLTQDGELAKTNDWLYTKYDILGRPIMTGLYTNSQNISEADLRDDVAAALLYEHTNNSTNGYTNQVFPTADCDIHTVSYYDDYDFNNDNTDDFSLDAQIGYTASDQFDRIKGHLTGTKVKVLGSSPVQWLHTVVFYDDRGQAIQIQGENHLNGADILTTQYDFGGKLLRSERKHTVGGKNPLYVVSTFDYDHAGRLLNLRYGVGDASISGTTPSLILNTLRYDKIGRLIEKKLHSTNGRNYLQNIDYKFNIRGWLTDINNVNFGGLTAVELSEEATLGLIDRIKDSEIEIELNISDLNAGIYDEVEVTDERTEERGSSSEERTDEETLTLDVNAFQSNLTDMFTLDYTGETVDAASYEQEFEQLRTDLDAEMTNQGIIDQEARDLIEEEVLGYFRDNWLQVVANDNNDDLFAMHLDYTTSNAQTEAVAQYGGNISQATWRVRGDANKSVYGYQYDDLGRLTQAKYAEYDANNTYMHHDRYTVSNITYDLNSNIQTLNRMGYDGNGYSMIDQLNYSYKANTNELDAITGDINTAKGFKQKTGTPNSNQYTYDDNGRMTEDKNKGITITYNHLDLPTRIDFTGVANKYIEFKYDAAGVKLEKKVSDNGNITYTQYTAGIEYSGSLAIDGTVTLEMVYHSDGRFYTTDDGKTFQQEYILRDNQGNTRVVFEDIDKNGKIDPLTEISQKTHYYPFGMEIEAPLTPMTAGYKHLYNGKEAVKDLDLGWYDYGARWYDASIARWSSIDPMGEMMASWSSYNYCFNNPINFTDPTGMVPEDDEGTPESTEAGGSTSTDAADNTTGEVVVTGEGSSGGAASKGIKPVDAGAGKPSVSPATGSGRNSQVPDEPVVVLNMMPTDAQITSNPSYLAFKKSIDLAMGESGSNYRTKHLTEKSRKQLVAVFNNIVLRGGAANFSGELIDNWYGGIDANEDLSIDFENGYEIGSLELVQVLYIDEKYVVDNQLVLEDDGSITQGGKLIAKDISELSVSQSITDKQKLQQIQTSTKEISSVLYYVYNARIYTQYSGTIIYKGISVQKDTREFEGQVEHSARGANQRASFRTKNRQQNY